MKESEREGRRVVSSGVAGRRLGRDELGHIVGGSPYDQINDVINPIKYHRGSQQCGRISGESLLSRAPLNVILYSSTLHLLLSRAFSPSLYLLFFPICFFLHFFFSSHSSLPSAAPISFWLMDDANNCAAR